MSSKYMKEHYKEIAYLLADERDEWVGELRLPVERLAQKFADLFAADNPNECIYCLQVKGKEVTQSCTDPRASHTFAGFDHEKFLTACGLEESKANA